MNTCETKALQNGTYFSSEKKVRIYLGVMLALIFLFLGNFILDPTGNQNRIFFGGTQDYMADYYNVAKFSITRNPYYYGLEDPNPGEHAYPPLAYLIFYVRARFADYTNLSAFEAGATTMGRMTSTFAVFLEMGLLIVLLRDAINYKGILKNLIAGTLVFSSVFLFSAERGNIIGMVALCTAFFVMNYKSENQFVRELALIALAVAAGLKVYPAILGILLIYEKLYKEAVRCIIYGAVLFFFPFLFFKGGFGNIRLLLYNVGINTKNYTYGVYPRFNFRFWTAQMDNMLWKERLNLILGIVDYIICIGAVVTAFFQKDEWKKIMLLLLAIVILPANSAEYTGLYLFIGFVLFLNERKTGRMDWIYLAFIIMILNPFQIVISDFNITVAFMNLSAWLMLVLLCMETLMKICTKMIAGR